MISYPEDIVTQIARLYAAGVDHPFESILAGLPGAEYEEETLADVIDADGRARIERRLDVTLERYLESVPDLTAMPIALDAAIEFALRGLFATRDLSASPDASARAVEALILRFPSLESPIRTALILNEALCSTANVRRTETTSDHEEMTLPSDYGPIMPDGSSRYELRSRLGRGAHGAVYLGVDRHLSDEGRPAYIAIKILGRGADHARAASVREEAVRARRINHPHVVRVLDRGVDDDGRGYIVYEYVDGPSMRTWLAQRSTPPTTRHVVRLISQVAHGVQAAHAAGIVHCDIKPDNIIMARPSSDHTGPSDPLAGDAVPKVTDFGVAVCLESVRAASHRGAAAAKSAGAAVWGSLGFVAPEQFRADEGALSPSADVYALGGVLYYLLTGRIPNGQSPDEVRRNLQHLDGAEHRDHRALRFDRTIDRDLEAICRRALDMSTLLRYASAEALASDLERWLRREPLRWLRPTLHRRLTLFARREPLACLLIAAFFLGALVVGGGIARLRTANEYHLMQAETLAQREAMEARVQAARRLERDTHEWYERYRILTQSTLSSIAKSKARSTPENWLTTVIMLESFFGRDPRFGTDDNLLWIQRIDSAKAVVAEARERSADVPIVPLLWESALGFWLLGENEFTEAREVLARNRSDWSLRAGTDDPWPRALDLLHACAVVREFFLDASERRQTSGAESQTTREIMLNLLSKPDSDLAMAVAALQDEARVFTGTLQGGAAHRTVLATLHDLYGAAHLDDPIRRQEIKRRLASFSQ